MIHQVISFIAEDVDLCFEFMKQQKYIWRDNDNFPGLNIESVILNSIKNDIISTSKMVLIIDNKDIYSWDFCGLKFNHKAICWLDLKKQIRKEKIKRLL